MRKLVFLLYKFVFYVGKNLVPSFLIRLLNLLRRRVQKVSDDRIVPSEYWSVHSVPYEEWLDAAESLNYFNWRNAQYPGYIELMPVNEAQGLTVMDYGCGPGNDLVGFYEFSRPARLIGIDVSETVLAVAKRRTELHGCDAELFHIRDTLNEIPVEDNSIDLVHSSGVLHHVSNLEVVVEEIKRVMKPDAKLQVMVYNYDSLWLQL